MIVKNLWFFPLILFCTFIFFGKSFSYYFFQDDWFVLNWVSQGDPISFFEFRTDIIYWRPLTMPTFFALGKEIFGLNPTGFHLIVFIFHFINATLVYRLFKVLKLSDITSKLSAFIYAVSAFHFIGLSWLSTASYVIGVTFILGTIISFLKSKFTLAFLFFAVALASTEFSLVCVPLLLLFKKLSKKTLFQLSPIITTIALYLVTRVLVFPVPAQGDYGLGLSLKTITNTVWYFLWTFNFAEKFSTIFFISNIRDFPGLFLSQIKYLIFPIILILTAIYLVLVSRLNIKVISLGFSWFLISLTPVILVSKHVYPIYLPIASLGLIFILARAIETFNKNKILPVMVISIIWFISAFITLDFTRETHWIANGQAISRAYSNYIKGKIQKPSDHSVFIIKLADLSFSKNNGFTLVATEQNVRHSFNDQDAIQVIYNNPTLKSIFASNEEPINVSRNTPVYEISPRLER